MTEQFEYEKSLFKHKKGYTQYKKFGQPNLSIREHQEIPKIQIHLGYLGQMPNDYDEKILLVSNYLNVDVLVSIFNENELWVAAQSSLMLEKQNGEISEWKTIALGDGEKIYVASCLIEKGTEERIVLTLWLPEEGI